MRKLTNLADLDDPTYGQHFFHGDTKLLATKLVRYSLVLGIGFIIGCQDSPGSLNGAAALRWKGAVDLDLDFSEFFGTNHTIAFWVMMQYPYGPAGPMVAENGTGTFAIGQGDYRWGNGGFKMAGDPVLYVRIGTTSQTYTVPALHLPELWAHLAMVRSGNTFTLYVNGTALSPSINYSGPAPVGNLRLGRRTDGMNHGMSGKAYVGQFYGFIDEVAVFDKALSVGEINNLRNSGLTGYESGLVAGFPFDFGEDANALLPADLKRSFTEEGTAYRALLSKLRDSVFDTTYLPMPEKVVELTLPYNQNEAWVVGQGMNNPNISHNGTAAFSLDLTRANSNDSTGEPLYAIADGMVTFIKDWNDCDPQAVNTGSNPVVLQMAPNEFAVYHHLQKNSVMPLFGIGPDDFLPQFLPDVWKPQVLSGDQIGDCGSTGLGSCSGAHNHLSVRDTNVSHPFAFTDYEVSDDQGQTWTHIPYGIPQQGQWIRLP